MLDYIILFLSALLIVLEITVRIIIIIITIIITAVPWLKRLRVGLSLCGGGICGGQSGTGTFFS
jgi:hypothetical protein